VIVPAGAAVKLGPFQASANVYLYGTGTGSAYYAFEAVFSEGP
jgi:hypothetical protein